MMWILSHHKFAAHLAEVEIMKNFLADLPIPVGCPGISMGQGVPSASLPFWQIGIVHIANRLDFSSFRSSPAARYSGKAWTEGGPVLGFDRPVREG